MTKTFMARAAAVLGGLLLSFSALAAAPAGGIMQSGTDLGDKASLQRGAKLFMNYCSGCHSLHFLRYSRMAKDLGLSEKEVMQHLNFTNGKFLGPIVSAMPAEGATQWFGKPPPDLSLVVALKGADWVYTYLNSFYFDPSSAVGWNNTVLKNAAMPNVLWPLQGIQTAKYGKPAKAGAAPPLEGLVLTRPGRMTPTEYHQATRDITDFLQYASEPVALKRTAMAPWVLLYLVILTVLLWLVKRSFWKDVH